jgi:hypothetical protein
MGEAEPWTGSANWLGSDCQIPGNAIRNPLIATVMDLVA